MFDLHTRFLHSQEMFLITNVPGLKKYGKKPD